MSKDEVFKEACSDCGCTAEVGTIIGENDVTYECELNGTKEEVIQTFTEYEQVAKDVDNTVQISFNDAETNGQLTRKATFVFSCSAEKLIFQMKAHAI